MQVVEGTTGFTLPIPGSTWTSWGSGIGTELGPWGRFAGAHGCIAAFAEYSHGELAIWTLAGSVPGQAWLGASHPCCYGNGGGCCCLDPI